MVDIGIAKRIKSRREELGLTQDELATLLNYKSRSSIYKIEIGENDIPHSKIKSFAKALQTTPSFLMGWDEETDIPEAENIFPLPKTKMVPLIGTIACGEPILANENIEEMVSMPEHINADFALRCKGNSMINARILDNDIVYIRQQETVENGEIAAVLIDNEATLKRFYRYGDTVVLRAENPNHKEFEYKNEQLNEIRILGKAVHFLSVVQ